MNYVARKVPEDSVVQAVIFPFFDSNNFNYLLSMKYAVQR